MKFHIRTRAARMRACTEKKLATYNKPSVNFFVLMGFSSAITALGVLSDNTAVVIGGMLVAPLITPIFGFSLSILLFKLKTLAQSLTAIVIGTVMALGVAYGAALLISLITAQSLTITQELLLRSQADLIAFLIALLSGMVGAYAYARLGISETLPGVAIAVSLIPPLAVSGASLAMKQFVIAEQSFLLYIFNLAGICFGSMLMFIVLGFGNDVKKQNT